MKKITALFLSFLIAIAPVYQAHAILPAVGSVVASVVGATVIDAGVTAAINVVAGKSPWAANDPVYGGQVKTPVKGVSDWVKKHGSKVAFWAGLAALAGHYLLPDGTVVGNGSGGYCSASSSDNFVQYNPPQGFVVVDCFGAVKAVIAQQLDSKGISNIEISDPIFRRKYSTYVSYGFVVTGQYLTGEGYNTQYKDQNVFVNIYFVGAPTEQQFNGFVSSALPKIKPESEPFTIPPSRYPSFPANDPVWPEKIEPVTPPAKPTKPFPTPVPTPQPTPTPDNPLYPSKPDTGRWPLPWPLPGLEPIPNPNPEPDPNPDPDTGTEIKPTPDGGFIIPNPLPVEVTNDVNVNVLNLEQGLTAAQLAQRDLRIDNDSAAGLGSPDSLTNDSYFDAFKPIDNMLGNLPSPPSFNFTSGMFGIPSYSSCIPYVFTIPSIAFLSMTIPAQSVTIGQHCDYYDANLRPFVAWIFQAIGLLTIYRISVRSTRL